MADQNQNGGQSGGGFPPIMNPSAPGAGAPPSSGGGMGNPPPGAAGGGTASSPQNPYGQQPQYGAPPPGYGYPPQQTQYGQNPYGQQPQYGAPPPGYGYPPPPPPPPTPVTPIGHFGRDDGFSTTITLPKHTLTLDENKFLKLLAGSVSLMKDEKKRIIEALPRLTQNQIDELIRILEEEKSKFSDLDVQHKTQLEALEKKHAQEWAELEMEMTAGDRAAQEAADAEKIRQQISGQKGDA